MTERIDLDELAIDDESTADAPPRGAWFWEGEGDPEEEVDPWSGGSATLTEAATDDGTGSAADPHETTPTGATDTDTVDDADGHVPMPRVPRTNDDRPVGIPMESGGSGGTVAGETPAAESANESAAESTSAAASAPNGAPSVSDAPDDTGPTGESPQPSPDDTTATEQTEASGPHGGGADEMTLAFTYNAITRLSHLHGALADAEGWTDWVGVVGDVEAYVINKFQRDNHLDLDFFNGSGTGPGERLAAIDEHSMFYADRMVLVGVEGADEPVAEEAGWEFVPLADAAAKAGWDIET